MQVKFYSKAIKAVMAVMLFAFTLTASAQGWEQLYHLPATNAFHIAKNGNFILADYQFDLSGGIYVSTDKGQNFEKTNAPDYTYSNFIENDEYIFAIGCSGRVARSNDGGQTWELLSYGRAVEEYIGKENVEWTIAYGLAIHDGKLFVADFTGGGIVYSEDNGETWKQTDHASLCYGEADPKTGQQPCENLYNLVSYEGNLYAFGVYFVYRYVAETNSWEVLRNDSNFMAISTIYQGKLCLARSVMNDGEDIPFIVTLDQEGQWGQLGRPEGTFDNNIRCMYADGDYLFVGMAQTGFYYSNDGGVTYNRLDVGYPNGDTPMWVLTDEDYVYLATYNTPWAGHTQSGLYRIAKSELTSEPVVEGLAVVSTNPSTPVEALSTIELTFNAEIAGQFDQYSMTAMKLTKDNSVACGIANYVAEGKVLTVTLDTEITTEGEYTLVIPEGLITAVADNAPYSGKHTFVVVAPQVGDVYTPDYTGQRNRTDRNVEAIKMTTAAGSDSYELTPDEQLMEYLDLTEMGGFYATAGEQVQLEVTSGASWVHYFVYIDKEADGFTAGIEEGSSWQPVGDLVAYSFYNNDDASDEFGWNSIGVEISGDARNKPAIPAFNVPAEPGKYRMRIKQDWSNIDPKGDSDGKFGDFTANGGQIIDITLHVTVSDGIEKVDMNQNTQEIYDLSGRKLNRINNAGIYIVNGKKLYVK